MFLTQIDYQLYLNLNFVELLLVLLRFHQLNNY